jgi:hypothetical protein
LSRRWIKSVNQFIEPSARSKVLCRHATAIVSKYKGNDDAIGHRAGGSGDDPRELSFIFFSHVFQPKGETWAEMALGLSGIRL